MGGGCTAIELWELSDVARERPPLGARERPSDMLTGWERLCEGDVGGSDAGVRPLEAARRRVDGDVAGARACAEAPC